MMNRLTFNMKMKTCVLAGAVIAASLVAGNAVAQSWPTPGGYGSGYSGSLGFGGYQTGRAYGYGGGYPSGYHGGYRAVSHPAYNAGYGYAAHSYGRSVYVREYATPVVARDYYRRDVVYAPVARTVKIVPVGHQPQLYRIQGYGYGY